MILRWQEVAVPLVAVVVLLALKHVPGAADLPLARTAGVLCFGYAIFLALRLIQGTEAVEAEGWSHLRASPVEQFGVWGAAAISALLLGAVLKGGYEEAVPYAQLALTMAMSLFFALLAGGIAFVSMLAKVRWDRSTIEHVDGLGKHQRLAWADVVGVTSSWRGVTIWAQDRSSISFSPYQSGAAQLTALAARRAERNASSAARAFAS